MPLNPPQDYRKTAFTHRQGLAADRPLATDVLVGTLYHSTDTNVVERSNGAAWIAFSGGGVAGATVAIGSKRPPGVDGDDGVDGEDGISIISVSRSAGDIGIDGKNVILRMN